MTFSPFFQLISYLISNAVELNHYAVSIGSIRSYNHINNWTFMHISAYISAKNLSLLHIKILWRSTYIARESHGLIARDAIVIVSLENGISFF